MKVGALGKLSGITVVSGPGQKGNDKEDAFRCLGVNVGRSLMPGNLTNQRAVSRVHLSRPVSVGQTNAIHVTDRFEGIRAHVRTGGEGGKNKGKDEEE